MADDVELVRSRTDIVDLVGQRVALKRAGKSWKGLCPFHDDKDPSFHVDPTIGRYRCWACGAKGDAFDWVMQTENVDFGDALRWLAKAAGVELKGGRTPSNTEPMEAAMADALAFFRRTLATSKVAQTYLEERGIDGLTATTWEIGFAPSEGEALAMELKRKGHSLALAETLALVSKDKSGGYYDRFRSRLMFPIRDERGRLVAFGGRIVGAGQPKYINSSETPLFRKSRVLYGMFAARETMAGTGVGVIVEGYLDAIACHRAGVTNAVAPLGTALGDEHAKLLKRWCKTAVLLFDGDTAGAAAAMRSCTVLREAGLVPTVASLAQGDDPDTLLRRGGAEAVQLVVKEAESELSFNLRMVEARLDPREPEFWAEATTILALGRDHLEQTAQLERLAARYPFSRDVAGARAAISRMVREARGRAQAPGRAVASLSAERRFRLRGLEAVVFRALAVPELLRPAWEMCRRPEMFSSEAGSALATAIAATFPDTPPRGRPADWLPQLAEEARDQLADVLSEPDSLAMRAAHVVDAATLADATSRLGARLEERERRAQFNETEDADDALAGLSEALRAAQGRAI